MGAVLVTNWKMQKQIELGTNPQAQQLTGGGRANAFEFSDGFVVQLDSFGIESTASISTRAPRGSSLTPTTERAGNGGVN